MFSQGNNLAIGNHRFFFLILAALCLTACAPSNVSRYAATNVDLGVQNAKSLALGAAQGSMADGYDNLSQTKKAALMGGALGATTGALANGVGALPGGLLGAVVGASYGAYINANMSVLDQMRSRGIQRVMLGDQVMLMIPSSRLFMANTHVIRPEAYPALNLVTQYLNGMTKMMVKVGGFTNDDCSSSLEQCLSTARAQEVARFLVADGLNVRLIYAQGYGSTRLIAKNKQDNDRIEIILEKLYV